MWNCRSVVSPLTVSQLREVIKLHSSLLVFLSETRKKKNYLNSVKHWIKLDNVFVVDPVGKAGSLAILWKRELQVNKVLFTSFTIELLIEDNEAKIDWWCICTYASSSVGVRREQWKVATRRSILWGKYWAIMGDLNDIISNNEKWGGTQRVKVRFQDFNSFINSNELVDVRYEGIPCIWSNNLGNEGEVKERIDRILGTAMLVAK